MHLRPDDHDWYREVAREWRPLRFLDAVLVCIDPPADAEFFTATWLLERPRGGRAACIQPAAGAARTLGKNCHRRVCAIYANNADHPALAAVT